MEIVSSFLSTDVTAVKIVGGKMLAGIGNRIHVYDVLSGTCEEVQHVFSGQKIHGLCLHRDQLLVYGGRLLAHLKMSKLSEDTVQPWSAPDWILSARWIEDGSCVALALAHNEVCLWCPETRLLKSRVVCEERCILYSAMLLGDTWPQLVMFAGTVFSEVVVWAPGTAEPQDTLRPVWHRLKGHKGVIFSIAFDADTRRILTCSDDRSVRVWHVSGPATWQHVDINPGLVLFGHTARVWRVLPTPGGFLSTGEDSLLCQWDAEGQVTAKVVAHQGGSIWSVDVDPQQALIVTGGGDGGIACWPLGASPQAQQLPELPWPRDGVRRVGLTARGRLVAVTEQGHVCWHRDECWTLSKKDERFSSYALLAVSPCRTRLALASLHGMLALYTETVSGLMEDCVVEIATGKVLALHWLTSTLLLASEVGARRSLWCTESGQFQLKGEYRAPGKDRGVSAAVLAGRWLIMGDQLGGLSVHDAETSELVLAYKLPRLVLGEGVTSLHFTAPAVLRAMGKEGHLHILQLETDGRLVPLTVTQTRLGWLVGLRDSTLGLLTLSFHREEFCIHKSEQQRSLMSVLCGGGHRSWDLSVTQDSLQFSFVRERRAYAVNAKVSDLTRPVLRGGLHWRVTNCAVAMSSDVLVSGGDEGTVRVWHVTSGRQLLVLGGHVSSVRSLCFARKKFLFSAGGRAQIIAWRISGAPENLQAEQLHSHMLLDSESRSRTPWADTHFKPRPDPETRYMDLKELPEHHQDSVSVLAACSDAMLRVLQLDLSSGRLSVTATLTAHPCCVLQVAVCDTLAVSAATDGHIALWRTSALEEGPVRCQRVHQSGVSCLSVAQGEEALLLASGGDDNTVTLSKVDEDLTLSTVWTSNQGHAAQVTGVSVIAPNLLLTTSVDQRVTLWQDGQQKCSVVTMVSDVQGFVINNLTRSGCSVCVFGKGFELFQVNW